MRPLPQRVMREETDPRPELTELLLALLTELTLFAEEERGHAEQSRQRPSGSNSPRAQNSCPVCASKRGSAYVQHSRTELLRPLRDEAELPDLAEEAPEKREELAAVSHCALPVQRLVPAPGTEVHVRPMHERCDGPEHCSDGVTCAVLLGISVQRLGPGPSRAIQVKFRQTGWGEAQPSATLQVLAPPPTTETQASDWQARCVAMPQPYAGTQVFSPAPATDVQALPTQAK